MRRRTEDGRGARWVSERSRVIHFAGPTTRRKKTSASLRGETPGRALCAAPRGASSPARRATWGVLPGIPESAAEAETPRDDESNVDPATPARSLDFGAAPDAPEPPVAAGYSPRRDVVRALLRFVGKRLWHRLSALLRDEAPVSVVYRPAARRFHEALELSSV